MNGWRGGWLGRLLRIHSTSGDYLGTCWCQRSKPAAPVVTVPDCRTYWGSHGCHLRHNHPQTWCACDCCECDQHPDSDSGCVATLPYYGPGTSFYGQDAAARIGIMRQHPDGAAFEYLPPPTPGRFR